MLCLRIYYDICACACTIVYDLRCFNEPKMFPLSKTTLAKHSSFLTSFEHYLTSMLGLGACV